MQRKPTTQGADLAYARGIPINEPRMGDARFHRCLSCSLLHAPDRPSVRNAWALRIEGTSHYLEAITPDGASFTTSAANAQTFTDAAEAQAVADTLPFRAFLWRI